MYKYTFVINGEKYHALFIHEQEALDFIRDNRREHNKIRLENVVSVSIADILQDCTLEYPYKVEMIALLVLPNANEYHKWSEQEKVLHQMDIL